MWWNANLPCRTSSSIRPFFRRQAADACVAALLTAALGSRSRAVARSPPRASSRHPATGSGSRVTSPCSPGWSPRSGYVMACGGAGVLRARVICPVTSGPDALRASTVTTSTRAARRATTAASTTCCASTTATTSKHHRHPSARLVDASRYRESSSPASVWPAPLRWLELNLRPTNLRPRPGTRRLVEPTSERVVLAHPCCSGGSCAVRTPGRSGARSGGIPRTCVTSRSSAVDSFHGRRCVLQPTAAANARLTIVDASAARSQQSRGHCWTTTASTVHPRAFRSAICNVVVDPCHLQCACMFRCRSTATERRYARPPARRRRSCTTGSGTVRGTSRIVLAVVVEAHSTSACVRMRITGVAAVLAVSQVAALGRSSSWSGRGGRRLPISGRTPRSFSCMPGWTVALRRMPRAAWAVYARRSSRTSRSACR